METNGTGHDWEDSFVQATGGIVDSGYIALVQKTLVVNATCIVIAGVDSQFQNFMLSEYKARVKHPCIYRVCNKIYVANSYIMVFFL